MEDSKSFMSFHFNDLLYSLFTFFHDDHKQAKINDVKCHRNDKHIQVCAGKVIEISDQCQRRRTSHTYQKTDLCICNRVVFLSEEITCQQWQSYRSYSIYGSEYKCPTHQNPCICGWHSSQQYPSVIQAIHDLW